MSDPVNHPEHYTKGRFEVIDVIEDWNLGYHLSQVVKYVARCWHKGHTLQDLKKARWYLDRIIVQLEELDHPSKTPPPNYPYDEALANLRKNMRGE